MTEVSITKPQKDTYVLLELRYGDPESPQYVRLTDWQSDVHFGGAKFKSQSNTSFSIPPYTGLFKEKALKITLPIDAHDDIILMCNGEPFSPIHVTIWEVLDATGEQKEKLHLYRGRVFRTTRNPSGRTNMVRIEARNIKGALDIAMGIPANEECWAPFGGNGCFALNVPEQNKTVDSIDGNIVTFSSPLSLPAGQTFTRGSIVFEGLRIGIRDWLEATTPEVVILVKSCPQWFLGESVTVRAGCTKSLASCQAYANEQHFGGIGYATPIRNPLIDD